MRARLPRSFLLLLLLLAGSASAQSRVPQRLGLIRGVVRAHQTLRHANTAVPLPSSTILSDRVASAKTYGDSWTCRSSTCLLIQRAGQRNVRLEMDSVGKNAFKWGKEGSVSYHYFGVDNLRRPTLLVDPTASSNFGRDARPGGLLHGLLTQAGAKLGQPRAAQRVARRIAGGGVNGLLVLTRTADIGVYREALEQAVKQLEMTRNSQRR